MFEGNKNCSVCKKELDEKDRNFGISMSGYTRVFCNKCVKEKKDAIKRILHDEEN